MTRTNSAVRAVFPSLVAVITLVVVSTFVVPQPLAAQCADCMITGTWVFGEGQPGGELDCVDVPEGMTDCMIGSYRDEVWCETSGSVCSALMLLDFAEDGMASWENGVDQPSLNSVGEGAEAVVSTCDGVLLKGHTLDDTARRSDVTVVLAL